MIIEPTVGRVVHYFPDFRSAKCGSLGPAPWAAIITRVFTDTQVGLVVFLPDGTPKPVESCFLLQQGYLDPNSSAERQMPEGAHCEWMAYQKGQAAKTEAAEKALAAVAPAPALDPEPLQAEFLVGEDVVVTLAGMADKATVLSIDRNDRTVRVAWWHDGNIRDAVLPRCVLQHASRRAAA